MYIYIYIYVYTYVYTYIYICVCVCVCVFPSLFKHTYSRKHERLKLGSSVQTLVRQLWNLYRDVEVLLRLIDLGLEFLEALEDVVPKRVPWAKYMFVQHSFLHLCRKCRRALANAAVGNLLHGSSV